MNPGGSAPDVPALSVGWRAWDVRTTSVGAVLNSPIGGEEWPPAAELRARCRTDDHTAPATNCRCGIHAARDIDHTWIYSGGDEYVVGCVGLWGVVVEGERGWRAGIGYPLLLLCSPSISPQTCHDLATRYRIPVYPLPHGSADPRIRAGIDWDVHLIAQEIRDNADPVSRDVDRLAAAIARLEATLTRSGLRRILLPSKVPWLLTRVPPILRGLFWPLLLGVVLPSLLAVLAFRVVLNAGRAVHRRLSVAGREPRRRVDGDLGSVRGKDALPALQEAVGLYRVLAADDPDHREDLAEALESLGRCYFFDLDRGGDALAPVQEAIGLYRVLAAEDPAHRDDLAGALDLLGSCYHYDLDRGEDALAPVQEAIGLYRVLAADDPDHRDDLAEALELLGRCYFFDLDRGADALSPLREAIGIYRALAVEDPASRRDLAGALMLLGRCYYSDLDQGADALSPVGEAIDIYRVLAADDPTRRSDLAAALQLLGLCYFIDMDQAEDAVSPVREAVGLYRALAADDPARHADLAKALDLLGRCQRSLGR